MTIETKPDEIHIPRLRFGATLPATSVTPEIRQAIFKMAQERNCRVADIVREAATAYVEAQKAQTKKAKR
jgi:hypothetical protein